MKKVDAYFLNNNSAYIQNNEPTRNWKNKQIHRCLPITLGNSIGWSICFKKDISFIWNGVDSGSTANNVQVLRGGDLVHTHRQNATITFNTGIIFVTDKNTSLLTISPPNYFIDGIEIFTTMMTTSFFTNQFPVVWKVTKPNKEIVIPAGTPIATVIPISLKDLSSSEINLHDFEDYGMDLQEYRKYQIEYFHKLETNSEQKIKTDFYRDETDHLGNKIGSHETKRIEMKINDFRKKEI